MQSWKLNNLISSQSDNIKLAKALELVKSQQTTGSLAANDSSTFAELYKFMQIYCQNIDITITGSEQFSGEIMTPKKDHVSLTDDIYKLLVWYYNNAYECKFVTIADMTSRDINEEFIVVMPNVNQYGHIQIGAEIFGSTMAAWYLRNLHILAKFIHDNETTELWPSEVQFYFEHSVKFQNGKITSHYLAFVKWHLKAFNQARFHCQLNNQDKLSNIELWEKRFHELDRDSIIPIHNIYSQFVPEKFIVGIWKPKEYMAVVLINRQFHL